MLNVQLQLQFLFFLVLSLGLPPATLRTFAYLNWISMAGHTPTVWLVDFSTPLLPDVLFWKMSRSINAPFKTNWGMTSLSGLLRYGCDHTKMCLFEGIYHIFYGFTHVFKFSMDVIVLLVYSYLIQNRISVHTLYSPHLYSVSGSFKGFLLIAFLRRFFLVILSSGI